jgi:hypothetical protein
MIYKAKIVCCLSPSARGSITSRSPPRIPVLRRPMVFGLEALQAIAGDSAESNGESLTPIEFELSSVRSS